ncbi:hypothetical protein K438DRAFT_1577068 [Mycena galopus ATCC 62051]|nr:hypothetical protein K438DRAFT_1577068 [Mycena galopus ATCC 62051]
MKFTTSFIALVAATLSQTAASVDTTADECGALGVMEVPDVLPEGVNPTDIRKCAGHPVELNGTRADRDDFQGLVGRACVTSAQFGCTEVNGVGYCWKVCGPGGEWCWTASNGGYGGWDTCISANNCGTDNNAYGCGAGGCASCGCSC